MEREGFLQRIQWQKAEILWTTEDERYQKKLVVSAIWTKCHGKHVQYMDVTAYYGRIFFCFSLIILPSKIWRVLILYITWNLLLPVHFQILDLLSIRPSLNHPFNRPDATRTSRKRRRQFRNKRRKPSTTSGVSALTPMVWKVQVASRAGGGGNFKPKQKYSAMDSIG